MSASEDQRSEDHLLCFICQNVFDDPVTTPCGHNFCKTCITQRWDAEQKCLCPQCEREFASGLELNVNSLLSEMVDHFRQETEHKSSRRSSEQKPIEPGDVPCDVCSENKVKAHQSCLECLTSYCQTHLETHLTISGLKRHQLMQPVDNLEDRMCKNHHKLRELFCQSDQACVCMLCSVSDHKTHDIVPLIEEYETKMAEVEETQARVKQMIQERVHKIEEMKDSVEVSEKAAGREKEGVGFFTELMESVQRAIDQFTEEVESKHKTIETRAEAFIQALQSEICELMARSSELEQLSLSKDHFFLFQSFSSLKEALPTKSWTNVSVHPPSYEGTLQRAVTQLEATLKRKRKSLIEEELRKLRQFAVDVTLDPDTANPNLILSEDRKQVKVGEETKDLPNNPERFSSHYFVLSKQSFSSGKFYFEVQVRGKTQWIMGVASESVNRKGEITLSPRVGLWTLLVTKKKVLNALATPPVRLILSSVPEKVGVFLDYEEGLVSFYDVGAAALIYSFTGCCFSGKLFPLFCPRNSSAGRNSVPLIICPVNHKI